MGKAKKLAARRPYVTEGFDPKVHGVRAEPLVLVIVPTRELACQIFDEARRKVRNWESTHVNVTASR